MALEFRTVKPIPDYFDETKVFLNVVRAELQYLNRFCNHWFGGEIDGFQTLSRIDLVRVETASQSKLVMEI